MLCKLAGEDPGPVPEAVGTQWLSDILEMWDTDNEEEGEETAWGGANPFKRFFGSHDEEEGTVEVFEV